MAYKVIILYRLYMPSYFLGTFTEYPKHKDVSTHTQIYLKQNVQAFSSQRKCVFSPS